MYEWRKLTREQRDRLLMGRQKNHRPWHGPPHFEPDAPQCFHLSAACYEHSAIIGNTPSRMEAFEAELIKLFSEGGRTLHAWCVLPNHWHALVRTNALKETIKDVGQMHGKMSFLWNGEDASRSRKCWHRCADRRIRSDRHFYVARNYIHNNPIKHGYVLTWEEWPFSSVGDLIAKAGRDVVLKQWEEYPILDMGEGWDD